jgi:hypothetical protein
MVLTLFDAQRAQTGDINMATTDKVIINAWSLNVCFVFKYNTGFINQNNTDIHKRFIGFVPLVRNYRALF